MNLSPVSFPTRSTSALAGDVVVVREVVSALAVTGTETVVLVLCTGWAPSASHAFVLRQIVLSPLDVVSWLGAAAVAVVTVSRSSGGFNCTLGIGPIKVGSRSLGTFNGMHRVPNHGVQESGVPTSSTLRFNTRLRTMPLWVPSKCSSMLLSRQIQTPSSMCRIFLYTVVC